MFSSATSIGNGAMCQSMRRSGVSACALASSIARVSATIDCRSTGCRRSALRPSREYTSRSSISAAMRLAELPITSR